MSIHTVKYDDKHRPHHDERKLWSKIFFLILPYLTMGREVVFLKCLKWCQLLRQIAGRILGHQCKDGEWIKENCIDLEILPSKGLNGTIWYSWPTIIIIMIDVIEAIDLIKSHNSFSQTFNWILWKNQIYLFLLVTATLKKSDDNDWFFS